MRKIFLLLSLFLLSLSLSTGCANRAWTPASMSVASSYQGEPVARTQQNQVTRERQTLVIRSNNYYAGSIASELLFPSYYHPRTNYYSRSRNCGSCSRGHYRPRHRPRPNSDAGYRVYSR